MSFDARRALANHTHGEPSFDERESHAVDRGVESAPFLGKGLDDTYDAGFGGCAVDRSSSHAARSHRDPPGRSGMRGVLVRTGKFRDAPLTAEIQSVFAKSLILFTLQTGFEPVY